MIFVALDMILVAIKLIILGMLVFPYIYIKHLHKVCNKVNVHYCFLEINIIYNRTDKQNPSSPTK